MSNDAQARRDLDEPRTSEALREPDNIRRRPIQLPPMLPIKSDAIGSVLPDEPELTVVQPWDLDIDPAAESVEDAFATIPARWRAEETARADVERAA